MIKSVARSKGMFAENIMDTDANRLYSMLLDSKASAAAGNVYEISESLLREEKENTKKALDKLWRLKKNLSEDEDNGTISIMIEYYQGKLDLIRKREQRISKISRDSREMLSEKRKRDSEMAKIHEELRDSKGELERLNKKIDKLKTKEQELKLVDMQLSRELASNTNEIINGLYEMLTSSGMDNEDYSEEGDAGDTGENQDDSSEGQNLENSKGKIVVDIPRKVIKDSQGRVTGEYYVAPDSGKENSHYIYNSIFFLKILSRNISLLKKGYDEEVYNHTAAVLKGLRDKLNGSIPRLHFDVSTNEFLNIKTVNSIFDNLERRRYDDILYLLKKLKAKIKAMGGNYAEILREQLEKYNKMEYNKGK